MYFVYGARPLSAVRKPWPGSVAANFHPVAVKWGLRGGLGGAILAAPGWKLVAPGPPVYDGTGSG